MRTISKIVVVTMTFLIFFYSTIIAMSLMYALDSALVKFGH